jgi:hypothetical protein
VTSHPKQTTASSRNALDPWKAVDIESFDQLCTDALRIGAPTGGGLMGDPPSSYSNVDDAKATLYAHPIYLWLSKHSKATLDAFETVRIRPLIEFKFLRYLVRQMKDCRVRAEEPTDGPRRREKAEDGAARAIEHLQRHMDVVSKHLSSTVERETLKELIGRVKASLLALRPSGRKHPRRFLRALAVGLVKEFGFVEPAILFDASMYAGIELSERDAQRYCKDARDGAKPH